MRLNNFDEDKLHGASDQLAEFDQIHAEQPGFVGNVTVDLGRGRRFVLNVWSSATHQQSGLQALAPAVERLVNPLLTEPSQLIGDGDVINMDSDRTARE